MQEFNPAVLPEDLPRVRRVRERMLAAKTMIYKFEAQMAKIAIARGSEDLSGSLHSWLEHSDMLVSTAFDLVHFDAQIRHRTSMRRLEAIPGMKEIREAVAGRNADALSCLPDAESVLLEAWLELVDPEKRDAAEARVQKVFDSVRDLEPVDGDGT